MQTNGNVEKTQRQKPRKHWNGGKQRDRKPRRVNTKLVLAFGMEG